MYIIKNNSKIKIKVCNNFFSRFLGSMFKKNITDILCFPKCNSIHTFFMFNPIDVIMTDRDLNVLYIYKNLKPNKIIWPKKNIYYTFEIPVDTLKFKLNDKINIKINK